MDQELVHEYEKFMSLNTRMKEANDYFKLYKCTLAEIALDDEGYPTLRNLPRHTYKVTSYSLVTPERPDCIGKIIIFDKDRKKERIAWWTDESHVITDGYGNVDEQMMLEMDNPDWINPYGILPFVYINSSTFSVDPIPNQDLLNLPPLIALILSDLAFAIKYLSWGTIYTVGAGDAELSFSPNSVIALDYGPDGQVPQINTVRPQIDIDQVLKLAEFLISMLLTTNNLSSSTLQGQLTSESAASGVSKALDSAESQEDKKDQQAYFRRAEKELWHKMAFFMVPYWRRNRLLASNINREFSKTFEINILFPEPQIIISERDMIELANMRVSSGWSTKKRELRRMNPDLDDSEIELLVQEIEDEEIKRNAKFMGSQEKEEAETEASEETILEE